MRQAPSELSNAGYTWDVKSELRRWVFLVSICMLTLFGVFVLPFLIPPPYLAGVLAANVAGFNNKVSALAAAFLGVSVLLVALRFPTRELQMPRASYGKLSTLMVAVTVAVCASIDALFCAFVAASRLRFDDASYFIDQINDYVSYGRTLYGQIEFPYGPIIFYGPV